MSKIYAIIDEGEAQIKLHEDKLWYFIDDKPVRELSEKEAWKYSHVLASIPQSSDNAPSFSYLESLTGVDKRTWSNIQGSEYWKDVLLLFSGLAPKLVKIAQKHQKIKRSEAGKAGASARWKK
jgi:hypothetical protein